MTGKISHVHFLCVLLSLFTTPGDCARVILIPWNMNSHIIYFHRLANGLAAHGHVTTLLIAGNSRGLPDDANSSVEIVKYSSSNPEPHSTSEEFSKTMFKLATSSSLVEKTVTMWSAGKKAMAVFEEECDDMMTDENLQRHLRTTTYDIAVMDGSYCSYVIPYKFNIPYIFFGLPAAYLSGRVPALPSFVPSPFTDYSDEMTFGQRMWNAIVSVSPVLLLNFMNPNFERYVHDKPPLSAFEIFANKVMVFHLREDVLSYPAPSMPNYLDIGDIMASPAKPLPADLQMLMDSSEGGVVIVSLGSYLDHIPLEIIDRFCGALVQLKETIIWKSKMQPACLEHSNIKVFNWIPQNDLLGHNNTKLFLTHGGLNSLIESVYHGVPLVVISIGVDQHHNAGVVKNKGYGLRLDIANFTSEELLEKMTKVLTDNRFREKIRTASEIMRHKPESAAARASFWIDHVVKFGSGHLQTSATSLSLLQFMMFDIFLFLLLIVVFLFVLVVVFVYFMWKLCRMTRRRQTKKTKTA